MSQFNCEVCELAKHERSVFRAHPYKKSTPFTLIHSDIWGPSRVPNLSNTRWFISFIDDYSKLCWIYLIKEKSKTFSIFKQFHSMVQTQFNSKIKIVCTDNGTDYFSNILRSYFKDNDIIHHSSCVNTPQQNGIAERKNRHLLEVAHTLMFQSNVPKHFWGEAILTTTFLINRMSSRVLGFLTTIHVFSQVFPHNCLFF